MHIAHTASVMFSQFMSFFLITGGGGGGVGCPGKCTLSTFLLQKSTCPWGEGVSRKVHSEHILATKVLMPAGRSGCLGKCTMSTFLLQKCSCLWGSRKMYYSGNVPGNKHNLGLPARGMQSIFELPSCSLIVLRINILFGCHVSFLLLFIIFLHAQQFL